jgi:hypothetical protein
MRELQEWPAPKLEATKNEHLWSNLEDDFSQLAEDFPDIRGPEDVERFIARLTSVMRWSLRYEVLMRVDGQRYHESATEGDGVPWQELSPEEFTAECYRWEGARQEREAKAAAT